MFRLSINIGGAFDLFVSGSASGELRSAAPSVSTSNGTDGPAIVECLRSDSTVDFGRARSLLLLTESSTSESLRKRIRAELERELEIEFDRLMAARNREEVAKERKKVYEVCEHLEEALILGDGTLTRTSEEEDYDVSDELTGPSTRTSDALRAGPAQPERPKTAELFLGKGRSRLRLVVASAVIGLIFSYLYLEFIESDAISDEIGQGVTNIQDQFTSDSGSIAKLHTKIQRLEIQVGKLHGEFSSEGGSISTLNRVVNDLSTRLHEVNSEFTSERGSIHGLKTSIRALDNRTLNLQNEFTSKSGAIPALKSSIFALNNRTSRLQTEFTSETGSIHAVKTSILALDERTSRLQTEFTSETGSIHAVKTSILALDERTSKLQNEFTSETGSIHAVKSSILALDERSSRLQTEFTSETGAIGTLRSNVAGLGSQVSRLESELTSEQGAMGSLQYDVQELDRQTRALRNDFTSDGGPISALKVRSQGIESQILRLHNQFTSEDGPITGLKTSIHKLDLRISRLQDEFTAEFGPISLLIEAIQRLDKEVTRIQNEFTSPDGPIAGLRTGIQRIDRRVTNLRSSRSDETPNGTVPDSEATLSRDGSGGPADTANGPSREEASGQTGTEPPSEEYDERTPRAATTPGPASNGVGGNTSARGVEPAGSSSSVSANEDIGTSSADSLTPLEWRKIQKALSDWGFDPGPIDGVPGKGTRSAIEAWEKSRGIEPTGTLTGRSLSILLSDEKS